MTKKFAVKRPLFVFCMTFFAVSILTAGVSVKAKISVIIACAFLGASTLSVGIAAKRRQLAVCAVLLILFPAALSLLLGILGSDRSLAQAESFDGISGEAELTIEEVRYSSSYHGYYTAHLRGNGTFPDMKVSLSFPDGSCEVGDVLRGEVTLRSLEKSSSFNEKTFFISDGILMSAEADTLEYVGNDSSFSITRAFGSLNNRLTSRIRAASGKGELVCAVLLGRRELLDPSVKRDFSRIGVSHLLALSGIHLSLTVSAFDFALDRLRIKGRVKCGALCLSILFYMALVGFTKSVTRAGVMHLIRYSGSFLRRRSDGLTALGIAALVIIAADPFAVYDTGLVLSVISAYACIVYSAHAKKRKGISGRLRNILRNIGDTVKLTLLITALSLPVSWSVFGETSLISPLTNIFFIPAISLFLHLSVIYLLLCGAPPLAGPLTLAVSGFESAVTSAAARLSKLRHISVCLRYEYVGLFCILLFVAVLTATFIYSKKRLIAVISVSLCTLLLCGSIALGYADAERSAELNLVTRGKNECFALRNGNEFILIDVSDGSSGISRELTFTAEKMGAVEISALVLTHLHRRHISSVSALADNVMLRYAYIPKAETDSDAEITEGLREIFEKRGIEYTEYSRSGASISHDGVTVHFPAYTLLSRSTHPIVTFFFTLEDRLFCYLGSSFEESGITDNDLMGVHTVFFGSHPPVRKEETYVSMTGNAVLTHKANEYGLLFIDADGKLTNLNDREGFCTKLPKSKK